MKLKNILVTGGAGFIGGCLIRKLITLDSFKIFNLDKMSYASNLYWLKNFENKHNHTLVHLDLCNYEELETAIFNIKPDLIMHLAAESHVDRSLNSPRTFISSNIVGTFNLLEVSRKYFQSLTNSQKNLFKFIHISTDEVFGSLGDDNYFDELSRYDPKSPYSASKASSDHLVRAWFKSYGLPVIITNCSNNYGPWQFPEKLIPLVILKAINNEEIPIYGNGKNIRDWLFVEDHVSALIKVADQGEIGSTYCIGGNNEITNISLVRNICTLLDKKLQKNIKHSDLINFVEDRPGHDYRYAIDATKIRNELKWQPVYDLNKGLEKTIDWYLSNLKWTKGLKEKNPNLDKRFGIIDN